MAYEYFIATKTYKSVVQGKKVSTPIIRISVISIVLAIIVNLITLAVVNGFQQEVRQKVSGFGSHIMILSAGEDGIYESEPLRQKQRFLSDLNAIKGIQTISPVAYKPVLFQSAENEISYTLANGKDTNEMQQNVFGAVIKGVDHNYDLSFFKTHLMEGELPKFDSLIKSNEILISRKLALKLHYAIGDEVEAFFVRKQPVKRKFKITGIYDTGLEEFDTKTVIGDLKLVQELNDWGIQASIAIEDTMHLDHFIIRADLIGGNGNYRCDWGKGFEKYTRFALCPEKDTTIRLIASDYWSDIKAPIAETALPDTAYLKLTVQNRITPCGCSGFKFNEIGELDKDYNDKEGYDFGMSSDLKLIKAEVIPGKGSSGNYVAGFEITIDTWEELDVLTTKIKKRIEFLPTEHGELLHVQSIKDSEKDIFVWLEFLDINVIIILTLMILIGIINVGSALLVLILIRTNFIGVLKALGASNWKIRKIFLIQATYLIARGLLWGNVIGLFLCFVQAKFGILSLNPDIYYLSQVPISLSFVHWLLLNVVTLLVCVSALIVPSIVITRIQPSKAIRFN